MSDLEPVNSKDVSSAGARGIGATLGGVGLMVATAVAGAFGGVVGLVLGGIALVIGASGLRGHAAADKTGGAITLGAGALLAVTGLAHFPLHIPIITGLARFSSGLVGIAAVGLIGYGVFNLIKFRKGLKSRT